MENMKKILFIAVLSIVSLLSMINFSIMAREIPSGPDHTIKAGADSPDACVDRLHQVLVQVMKLGETTPCTERYRILEPVLNDLFNFHLTCRLVLGRNWKRIATDKKKEFIRAFSAMSIATYADRFDDYNNEQFIIIGTRQVKKNRAIVKTVLVTSKGEEISLDYTCVNRDGRWQIVTVTAKGVNDLALKKAEYTSFLKKKDIDALIAFLKAQAEKCTCDAHVNLT